MRFKPQREWQKWFAWYPVTCGTTNHVSGTAWLETVEWRDIGSDPYEGASIHAEYTYRFINDPTEAARPHRKDD